MNNLNAFHRALAIVSVLCLVACGCDKQEELPQTSAEVFASASPEIQQCWKGAVTCAETDNYLGAATNLLALRARQASLSKEQTGAMEELWAAMGNKIFAAAEKGNPEAVKAMQAIRGVRSR